MNGKNKLVNALRLVSLLLAFVAALAVPIQDIAAAATTICAAHLQHGGISLAEETVQDAHRATGDLPGAADTETSGSPYCPPCETCYAGALIADCPGARFADRPDPGLMASIAHSVPEHHPRAPRRPPRSS